MKNCSQSVHVCYALYDPNGTYSKFVGTSVVSIFENTSSSVTVHILHDHTLSEDNKNKFIQMVDSYNQNIEFHSVVLKKEDFECFQEKIDSPAAVYRLSIYKSLPNNIDKAIYLDADTIVNMDINKLWDENLEKHPIGAVADICVIEMKDKLPQTPVFELIETGQYFNSGILLMHLEKFRNNYRKFFKDSLSLIREHDDWVYYDQDVLNVIFKGNYKILPYKYNKLVLRETLLDLPISEGVYHYAGGILGVVNNSYNRLFWQYFKKTPWCDISRIFEAMTSLSSNQVEQTKKSMYAMINARHRNFIIVDEKIKNQVKKWFPEDGNNTYQNVSSEIMINKGELSIFILQEYGKIKKILEQHGGEEYIDFIDGGIVFTSAEDFISYKQFGIIKSL